MKHPAKKRGPKPGAANAGRPRGESTVRVGFLLPESVAPCLAAGVKEHGSRTGAILAALVAHYPVSVVSDAASSITAP